jgi:crossover junction endodeoxyribonuclease RuvC
MTALTDQPRSTAVDIQPLVVGVDLSLTGTGIAHLRGQQLVTELIEPPANRNRDLPRLRWVRATVIGLCKNADLVVVEGPSYGSSGAGSHDRAGLYWMVRDSLWSHGIPVAICPPSSLKKYALGVGGGKRASKDHVLAACVRRFPSFDGENNQADAVWMAAAGVHHLTGTSVATGTHVDALTGVAWPEVTR